MPYFPTLSMFLSHSMLVSQMVSLQALPHLISIDYSNYSSTVAAVKVIPGLSFPPLRYKY